MRHLRLIGIGCVVLLLAGCSFPGMIPPGTALAPAVATPTATPLPGIRMPQDEAPHRDLLEWWYYTGHLQGSDAQGNLHTYGFEVTFFQVLRGNLPPTYIGHYAVSDITANTYVKASHTASEPQAELPNGNSRSGFNLAIADWTMQGLDGHDQVHAAMPDYTLTLKLASEKAVPVLQNGNGILQRGITGFSYYYSRTRMATSGTLIDHGTPITVNGIAWMDHQWGNFILGAGEGWDWFSIQLNNDTEYMVFFLNLPTAAGMTERLAGATLIKPDGSSTLYTSGLADVNRDMWTSPTTQIAYPSGWDITIPGAHFTIIPAMRNQEFTAQDASGQAYWEGASTVKALINGQEVDGQSFVELTGYVKQT